MTPKMTATSERAATPPPVTPPAGSGGRFKTIASLQYRDYRLLWLGTVVMATGQWLQQVVLSWLVFDLTGSAFLLGLINGVRFLPFLFTSLVGGVLADRTDRRRLMLGTQWYVFGLTLAMALLFLVAWPFAGTVTLPPAGVLVALLVTGLLASAGAFLVQTTVQQHIPAARTAIILTMEPVFAALFGYWLAGDRLVVVQLLGAIMILSALVIGEVVPVLRRGK